jgi:uncharacterized protein YyaL (SSP411 family)
MICQIAGAAALASCLLTGTANADTPLDRAYSFLDRMMDLYDQGATLRLVQSYVSTQAFDGGDVSYTYDDDVMVAALLARGAPDDRDRARVLGESLLAAQASDPLGGGRVRNAYHARAFLKHGVPNLANAGSDCGNLAWTGLAFLHLFHATKDARYLDAAKAVAGFVAANATDTRGAGGYTGGVAPNQAKILWKSTEHNLDLYALFALLARVTRDPAWSADAKHALVFVKAMWNRHGGYFQIGTGEDGVTINTGDPTPEDVQTWSFLSTGLVKYDRSIDWALANLTATSGDFQGLSFEVADRSGVWFEGTAHAAAALEARAGAGDADKAAALIADVETGQAKAPNGDGSGIDAASKDGLHTDGGGDAYYAALHIGATGWYALAKQGFNPFKF